MGHHQRILQFRQRRPLTVFEVNAVYEEGELSAILEEGTFLG